MRINTKINGINIKCDNVVAHVTHRTESTVMCEVSGSLLKDDNHVQLYFNSYLEFDTQMNEVLNLKHFQLTRKRDVKGKPRSHIEVGVSDIDPSLQKQLLEEIMQQVDLDKISGNSEKSKDEVVVLERTQVSDGSNGRDNPAYKAVSKKRDEYSAIKKDIQDKQKEAVEARKRWEAAEQAAEVAKQSYYDIERSLQGMFMDAMGAGEQLTQLSAAYAKEC